MHFDPETEITVTCGSTEAMMASMLAIIQPGDEVVVPEPFYENYGPDAQISGATPRFVPLTDDFSIDEEAWKEAFSEKTRAVILNTPNNPTGKVFSKEELSFIADLCTEHDAVAITDEIYEHIVYDGHRHVSLGSLPGMEDRTITIGSFSKSLQRHGVAGRLRPRGCRPDLPHPEDPRLPDRRRPGPAPAGLCRCPGVAGILLQGTGGRV